MEWLTNKPDTFQYHLDRPEIDANLYIQAQRLRIGQQIASRHRIYLDTKQWIHMRDVSIGRSRNQIQADIFSRLKLLRSAGTIICPISYSVFVELMKQTDAETRVATARVIDQLADGCCCVPTHILTERELMYFMIEKTRGSTSSQPPILHAIWTKASFVLGDMMLASTDFPPDIESAMQRSMDDFFCSVSLEEMISMLPENEWPDNSDDESLLVEQLSEGKQLHAQDHTNFHDLFCTEINGGLDGLREILESVMVQFAQLSGIKGAVSQAERTSGGQMLANLVAGAFKFRKSKKNYHRFTFTQHFMQR
jgi:hypothetical protein